MRVSPGRLGQAGALLGVALQLIPFAQAAIDLQADSPQESYVKAAKIAADGLKQYYSGDTPGLFDDSQWAWWIAGGMFMELIEYANLTGDTSWNSKVKAGLLSQIGPDNDFRPDAQFYTEANDDQLYWGLAAMTAAEYNFDPPSSDQPSWLALAQAVFNRIQVEWNDPPHCGGGFRWQYNPQTSNSMTYKNTPTNGGFFELAARLATYTGNHTYAEWATKTYNWMTQNNIISTQSDGSLFVYDGVNNPTCNSVTKVEWTYNYGAMLAGSAYLYKYFTAQGKSAEATIWQKRTQNIISGTYYWFFEDSPVQDIMTEITCERTGQTCNDDEPTFKGFTVRWLTLASFMVPMGDLNANITGWLKTSAVGAAQQCSGPNNACGLHWYETTYDGVVGPGPQMSAMSLFANNIVGFDTSDPNKAKYAPLTQDTGGNSQSDPSAGTGASTVHGVSGSSIADSLWDSIKTPVIASIAGVVGIALIIGGYFIWRKFFRNRKPAKKDPALENYYANEPDMNMTPTLPNVAYNYER